MTRTLYLIRQAQVASYALMEGVLSGFGLTPTQFTALSLCGQASPGHSSAELSRRLGVTAQAMNEVIATLERKLLIHRKEAPENRRILRIELTPDGVGLLERCEAKIDEAETAFLSRLDPEELHGLRAALCKLLGR